MCTWYVLGVGAHNNIFYELYAPHTLRPFYLGNASCVSPFFAICLPCSKQSYKCFTYTVEHVKATCTWPDAVQSPNLHFLHKARNHRQIPYFIIPFSLPEGNASIFRWSSLSSFRDFCRPHRTTSDNCANCHSQSESCIANVHLCRGGFTVHRGVYKATPMGHGENKRRNNKRFNYIWKSTTSKSAPKLPLSTARRHFVNKNSASEPVQRQKMLQKMRTVAVDCKLLLVILLLTLATWDAEARLVHKYLCRFFVVDFFLHPIHCMLNRAKNTSTSHSTFPRDALNPVVMLVPRCVTSTY